MTLIACGSSEAPPTPAAPPVAQARDAGAASPDRAAIQQIVDEELAGAVAAWQPAQAFAVVLVDGKLVANAGWDRGAPAPRLALEQPYVTGSTLKPFTVAIALEARAIAADDRFDCATRAYPGGKLRDASPLGPCSVTEILVRSSNVGASRIADRLGPGLLERGLRGFGFAALPAVERGSRREGLLAAGELAEATPEQVARAYERLFRGGDGVVSQATAATVQAMLVESLHRGTGKLAEVPGHRAVGKTGTAVLADDRRYASFVGTLLDRTPPTVILVGLVGPARGGTGPSAAAPLFARIAGRLP